jgi:hypothetical protein
MIVNMGWKLYACIMQGIEPGTRKWKRSFCLTQVFSLNTVKVGAWAAVSPRLVTGWKNLIKVLINYESFGCFSTCNAGRKRQSKHDQVAPHAAHRMTVLMLLFVKCPEFTLIYGVFRVVFKFPTCLSAKFQSLIFSHFLIPWNFNHTQPNYFSIHHQLN